MELHCSQILPWKAVESSRTWKRAKHICGSFPLGAKEVIGHFPNEIENI